MKTTFRTLMALVLGISLGAAGLALASTESSYQAGADGSAGSPVYTFLSSPTTGLYRPSGGGLAVTVAGTTVTSFGSSALTANSFMFPGTGGVITSTAQATNGTLLIGSTTANPVLATLTGTANQIGVTNGAGTITLALVAPYSNTTYTLNGVVFGNGTSALGVTAQGATGTLLHGNAGVPTFATLALADVVNLGTTTQVLHGNAAGAATMSAVSLTADVSGVLPTANGGTGIAFFTAAGPSVARIYTFPDAATTVLTTNAAVTTAQGGTGVATLALNGALYGNGAGVVLATAKGAANTTLHGNAGAPTFALFALADVQSIGTTTQVLHGNAAGAATMSAVSMTADITGVTPKANGGSGLANAQAAITTAGVLIGAGAATSQGALTVTGLLTTSACMVSGPIPASWQTGIATFVVPTADTATLWLINGTAGGITPAAQAVNIKCII